MLSWLVSCSEKSIFVHIYIIYMIPTYRLICLHSEPCVFRIVSSENIRMKRKVLARLEYIIHCSLLITRLFKVNIFEDVVQRQAKWEDDQEW